MTDDSLLEYARQTMADLEPYYVLGPDGKDARLQRVFSCLQAAARNLSAAAVGVEMSRRLLEGRAADLTAILGGAYDALEHAAMSLAVEDAITAIDLCAAALAVALPDREPPAWGEWQADVDQRELLGRIPLSWGAARTWLVQVRDHAHYRRLQLLRNTLVHGDYQIAMNATQWASGAEVRRPSHVWARAVRRGGQVNTVDIQLPGYLATALVLGQREFMAFCDALRDSYRP